MAAYDKYLNRVSSKGRMRVVDVVPDMPEGAQTVFASTPGANEFVGQLAGEMATVWSRSATDLEEYLGLSLIHISEPTRPY